MIGLIIIKESAAEHGAELSLWKINSWQESSVSALLPRLKVGLSSLKSEIRSPPHGPFKVKACYCYYNVISLKNHGDKADAS